MLDVLFFSWVLNMFNVRLVIRLLKSHNSQVCVYVRAGNTNYSLKPDTFRMKYQHTAYYGVYTTYIVVLNSSLFNSASGLQLLSDFVVFVSHQTSLILKQQCIYFLVICRRLRTLNVGYSILGYFHIAQGIPCILRICILCKIV